MSSDKIEVLPWELPGTRNPQLYIDFFDNMIKAEKKPYYKVYNWHTGEFEEVKNENYQDGVNETGT